MSEGMTVPAWDRMRAPIATEKDRGYMRLALEVAEMSKCVRAQYGTVIVSEEGLVVTTAFNGKPRGACNDGVCYREGLSPNSTDKPNCCIHSEQNALMFSSVDARRGGTMYISGIPCKDCALLIMQSGIKRLVYLDNRSGHRGNSDYAFWRDYGVPIVRMAMLETEL
jgi:dCMP deaminase